MSAGITVWLGFHGEEIRFGSKEQEQKLMGLGQRVQSTCPHPCQSTTCTCCTRLVNVLSFLATWARERQSVVETCYVAVAGGRQDITVAVHCDTSDASLKDALADLDRALIKHFPHMPCLATHAVPAGQLAPLESERTIAVCASPCPSGRTGAVVR